MLISNFEFFVCSSGHTALCRYLCRAITGFSVGGALPLIYSILGDLFAADDRHVVSAVVSFGTGAGISVGQAIAGYLGPTFGWRLPFLVVSIPALICALLVLLTVDDPERGGMEWAALELEQSDEGGVALVPITQPENDNQYNIEPSSDLAKLRTTRNSSSSGDIREEGQLDEYFDDTYSVRDFFGPFCAQDLSHHTRTLFQLLSTKTVLFAIIQGAPGCIPWGILNAFLNDYLSEDRGFSVEMATTTLMCFSGGHVVGLTLGGAGGKYLYQRDKRLPALLAGFMAILGCVPFWFLLNRIDHTTPYSMVAGIAFLSGFGSGPTGPIIKATLTNVTLPQARGQAFALFNLFDDFGKGLGPFFVSILIVQMGGRLPAFNVGILGWVACGLINSAVFFTVRRDEAAVQATLLAQLHSRDT